MSKPVHLTLEELKRAVGPRVSRVTPPPTKVPTVPVVEQKDAAPKPSSGSTIVTTTYTTPAASEGVATAPTPAKGGKPSPTEAKSDPVCLYDDMCAISYQ